MTVDQLAKICPDAPEDWLYAVADHAPSFGIFTPLRMAHFIGQLAHECDQFRRMQENLNYSSKRLMQVWPKRFPTVQEADLFAHNPEKLANHVYAARMGNRDEASGDGWRYRGRGPIQITGADNYGKAAAGIGLDLRGNPGLVLSPPIGTRVAGWFWQSNGLNELADQDDVEGVTLRINGGRTGLAERIEWVKKAKEILHV